MLLFFNWFKLSSGRLQRLVSCRHHNAPPTVFKVFSFKRVAFFHLLFFFSSSHYWLLGCQSCYIISISLVVVIIFCHICIIFLNRNQCYIFSKFILRYYFILFLAPYYKLSRLVQKICVEKNYTKSPHEQRSSTLVVFSPV